MATLGARPEDLLPGEEVRGQERGLVDPVSGPLLNALQVE